MTDLFKGERLGWISCLFSGLRVYVSEPDNCCHGWSYRTVSFVFGWWVYRFRIWKRVEGNNNA